MKLFLLSLSLAMGLSSVMGQNFTWGTQAPDDQLLEKRTAYSNFDIFGPVVEIQRFPPKPKNYEVPITAIHVVDKINNGARRNARITNGGVGENFVEIRFFAEVYRTYDYDVYIYGKKK